MAAATSILVATILIAQAWRVAHRFEGGLLPAEHFLIFLLMTGMFQTGGFEMGMNLSAWRLLVWIVLLGLVLIRGRPVLSRLTLADLPIVVYAVFLLWCIYRLTDAPSVGYGVRSFLKLLYPFLVLLLGRKAGRRGRLGVYLVPMIGAGLIISIFTSGVSEKIPYLVYNPVTPGIFWPRATFADHAGILVGVILTVLWVYRDGMPVRSRGVYLVGLIWLILSPLAVASRTGLLATAAALSGYALARYRMKAVPVIAGLFLGGLVLFVSMPVLRARTFHNANVEFSSVLKGEVDTSDIDSSGRFALWGELLDRFCRPHPWLGSGPGAVQEYLSSASFGGNLKVAHSDYVTLLCDTGLVGLLLYVSTAVSALVLAARHLGRGTALELRAAAALVLVSFLSCLCATGFDNVFNYTLPVHSLPFAFTGILLGLCHNPPAPAYIDPWRWSREHIWSRWLLRRKRYVPVPQSPFVNVGLYAGGRMKVP